MSTTEEVFEVEHHQTTVDPEAFMNRLMETAVGAFDWATIYVGDRLGLYTTLDGSGAVTPAELAERAGIHERYAREWLEQQAVTGFLSVDDVTAAEYERRYTLPPEYAEFLTDPESVCPMAPLAQAIAATFATLPNVVEAYRTGGGVPWEAYGDDMIESQGGFNRSWIVRELAGYLADVPDVHARLTADPPARVLDAACGVGWASIAIATAYPKVAIHAIDADAGSIDRARVLAKERGLDDRIRFEVGDAANPGGGPYDLAIVVEAIHDLARPAQVLSGIRGSLAPGGTVLVADERPAEAFTAPGDLVERFLYGAGSVICLPATMSEGEPNAATGAVIRGSTMRRFAEEAGFRDVEDLPFEPNFLRFYRLHA